MSIARHATYNLLGAAVPLIVSLVTVPIYLKIIGLDRYGVLSICWLLVGYFNLFDFGLGRAVSQKIATLADAIPEERSRVLWTAAALSSILALVAIAIFVPVVSIGLDSINLPNSGLRNEVRNAIPWLVAAVPVGIAQSLLAGALEGRREFLKLNLIMSIGTILTAVLPLAGAIWIGTAVPLLLAGSLIARSVVLLLLAGACVKAVPALRPNIGSRSEIKAMLSFGGWTTVANVIGPLMVYWDRFAIGAIIGSAAVAIYVVPFNLVWQILIVPTSLASALFPRLAQENPSDAQRTSAQSIGAVAFFMTPAAILAVAVAPAFLMLWVGSSVGSKTGAIACILLFGVWANSFGRIVCAHVVARGRPKWFAYLILAEILPYLILLYLLLRVAGLPGAALAWSIRCLADTIGLYLIDRRSFRALKAFTIDAALIAAMIGMSVALPPLGAPRSLFILAGAGLGSWILWHRKPARVDAWASQFMSKLLLPKTAKFPSRDE